jgi:rhamnulokinase
MFNLSSETMKESAYIAIDMGAGSIRVILGKLSDKLSIQEIHRLENEPVNINGHLRWDLNTIERGISFGIQKALEISDIEVQSISTDSWGVDFVLLGNNGQPLEFPVAYRDQRTEGMLELWTEKMSLKETFNRTGINYYPFNSLFQFLSIKDSDILHSARKVLFTASYINYFLGGEPVNELSLSSTSQMLNTQTKEWDEKILNLLNLPFDKLGKPINAGKIIGNLKKNIGNPNVKIVLSPGHDSASALVALPAGNNNFAFLSTGTWCVMGTESDVPFTSELALDNGITNEMTTEGKFRPLKNIMGLWLIQRLRKSINPELSYTEIEEMCQEINASEYTIDADNPMFYNPVDMVEAFDKAIYFKYQIKFKSPAEYFSCAYHSLAYSFSNNLKTLEKLRGKEFDTIHMTGGGCQSKILCQLTANATRLPVHAGPVEGASLGNILYQAIAGKQIKTIDEARLIVRNSVDLKTYFPQ